MGNRYAVVCQQAWCNSTGYGIVVRGKHLVSFDWMHKSVGEDDASMANIANAIGLKFRTPHPLPEHSNNTKDV